MNANYAPPSFHSLSEEYLRRRRAEGTYSIEEFADEFPHLRDEILSEFPGLVVAESLHEKEVHVALPQKLGRYELGQEMGRGAMGIVVAATNPDLESEVAIKLLPFERIKTMDMLHRFHTEAKICAAMEHPNIVPVFDYGTDDKFAYLVMRKVRGMSLDKLIAGLVADKANSDSDASQLDWDFITSIGIQAADALHYAHEQGVIHRDIKPANLILEKDGRLWVSDFGLSKVLTSDVNLSMTGDVLGTPRYMAPEQLRGVYNICSDVYSLGMTLYELVAVQPFGDTTMKSGQLLASKPTLVLPDLKKLNPAVPDALSKIIMRAIQLNPEDRYASAKELSTALIQSGSGTFIGDRRRKERQSTPRRFRSLALAATAGIVASASVYFLMPGQDDLLSNVLDQPETLGEIMDQEDAREIIIEKIPDLLGTALTTDSKEDRALFAEFAKILFEPSLLEDDGLSERQRTAGSESIRDALDAYVESGTQSPNFLDKFELNDKELMAAGQLSPEQIELLRNEINASSMAEEWKEHSQKQISRYQVAINDQSVSKNQRWRIKNFLVSLLTDGTNSGKKLNEYSLGSAKLRHFISMLETELDLADATAAESQ